MKECFPIFPFSIAKKTISMLSTLRISCCKSFVSRGLTKTVPSCSFVYESVFRRGFTSSLLKKPEMMKKAFSKGRRLFSTEVRHFWAKWTVGSCCCREEGYWRGSWRAKDVPNCEGRTGNHGCESREELKLVGGLIDRCKKGVQGCYLAVCRSHCCCHFCGYCPWDSPYSSEWYFSV